MIILRKKSTNHVEKIIQPRQTGQFFDLDLSGNEAYDWNIKIRCMGKSSITKITSLYNDDFIESTKYAFLGFLAGAEEIVIHEENIYDLAKSHRPYNVSVEDVIRTTDDIDRTPSQIARKVPLGKTDYIITKIKSDEDNNWENPISEGISYAHYVSEDQDLPYMMGGEF
jgi:hypothetical protein